MPKKYIYIFIYHSAKHISRKRQRIYDMDVEEDEDEEDTFHSSGLTGSTDMTTI